MNCLLYFNQLAPMKNHGVPVGLEATVPRWTCVCKNVQETADGQIHFMGQPSAGTFWTIFIRQETTVHFEL